MAVTPRFSLRIDRMKVQENLTGFLFILPAVALIGLFGLFPIGYALYMSLHNWRVRRGAFVGLRNFQTTLGDWGAAGLFALGFILLLVAYWLGTDILKGSPLLSRSRRFVRKLPSILLAVGALLLIGFGWQQMMAAGDARFLRSLIVTVYYAVGAIPIQIALGLLIAATLYQNLQGQGFFRMIFFVPYIVPATAAAIVFGRIFSSRDTGFANSVIATLGFAPQRWLQDPRPITQALFGWNLDGFLAGPSVGLIVIIIFGIWNYTGFNVVLFLAGLGGIPRELYEAAEIDGANRVQSFWSITVPMLSPITFYLSLIGFIGALQVFNTVYVMRTPQLLGSADTAGVVIFDTFFSRNQYGLATAQATLLFIVILFVTFVQYRILGKRVFSG
jgi:ABC-type sugar transport system permease subunit